MTITYLPDEIWTLVKAFQITKYIRVDDKVWNLIKEYADVVPPTCCRQEVRRHGWRFTDQLSDTPCFRRCKTTQDENCDWGLNDFHEYTMKGEGLRREPWYAPFGGVRCAKYYPLCEICLATDFGEEGGEEELLKGWVRGSASHRELEGPNTEGTGETILWKGKN